MSSNDKLSFDPLSANLSSSKPEPSKLLPINNRISSWAKHDLNHKPFSNSSTSFNSNSISSINGEEIESKLKESLAEVTSSSSSTDVESESSSSKAIQIRSGVNSLSRERSPSTSVLRGSPLTDNNINNEYGISITPRNNFNQFPITIYDNNNNQNNNLEIDSSIDFSTTPLASNSFALSFDQSPILTPLTSIYDSITGEINLELLYLRISKSIIEQETIYELQSLIEGRLDGNEQYPSSFDLINHSNPLTGLTSLHLASSHGKIEIIKYLIKSGAIIDLESIEGETSLNRASYRGHFLICKILLESGADVNSEDNDGWTPLHNACSKGYLDLVKLFIDNGAFIDKQSKHGYTALANASSKGHLAIVQFLITKHKANPFLRNAYQETAFDLAASVFEALICSLLANYESSLYSTMHPNSTTPYNPFLIHSTIPVILHENQRLLKSSSFNTSKQSNSLGNLTAGQNPRWSSKALSTKDKRAAFTMPTQIGFSSSASNGGEVVENRPVFRSEVGLPLIGNEGELVLPPLVAEKDKKGKGKGKEVARNNSDASGSGSGNKPSRSRSVSNSSIISDISPSSTSATSNSKPKGTRRISATSSLSAVLGSTSASSTPLVDSITPSNSSSSSSSQTEPAWFWLSDWIIDTTDLSSSITDGWSYSTSFDAPPEEWNSEPSNELLLALENNGTGSSLLVGGGRGGAGKFVRRRRWVRIMRRRLDIPSWGFGDESNNLEENGVEMVGEEEEEGDIRIELSSDADYLVKALFLVGELHSHSSSRSSRLNKSSSSIKSGKTAIRVDDDEDQEVNQPGETRGRRGRDLNRSELRKVASRLERAINELKIGMLTDENSDRRKKALDQSELFLHQLSLIQEELGLDNDGEEGEEDSDDEFVYSGRDAEEEDEDVATSSIASSRIRSSSIKSRSSYLSQQSNRSFSGSSSYHPIPTDLQPQLSRAPEFRVPTHETSIKVKQSTQLRNNLPPTTAIWESDLLVQECNDCSKKFNFFNRKHHCRYCGQIFCNQCCSNFDRIFLNQLVKEPGIELENFSQFGRYRTCDTCHLNLSLLNNSNNNNLVNLASLNAFFPNSPTLPSTSLVTSTSTQPSGGVGEGGTSSPLISGSESGQSDTSELQECPVCGQNLIELGSKELQESHVSNCLEVGGGAIARNGSYLVFKLPEGPLVNEECSICYVEFEVGDKLARLPCLDTFHLLCIRSWLEKGHACPYHAR